MLHAAAYLALVVCPMSDEELAAAFDRLSADPDSQLVLRSGKSYPRPKMTTPKAPAEASSAAERPIKLLPVTSPVKPFTGTDPTYTALEFFRQVEDACVTSQVTEPGEKISFARSQLAPNSRAAIYMSATTFRKAQDERDYERFKSCFLETFGEDKAQSLVKVTNAMAEKMATNIGSHDYFDSQLLASEFATHDMRVLRGSGWIKDEVIAAADLDRFLHFHYYILLLHARHRKASLSLSYPPKEELHEFIIKLKTKVEEHDGLMNLPASTVGAIPRKQTGKPAAPAAASPRGQSRSDMFCDHCKRTGHTIARCYARIKADKKSKAAVPAAGASPPKSAAVSAKPTSSASRGASKYCHFHQASSHNTEDCHYLKTLQARRETWKPRSSTPAAQPSGEAQPAPPPAPT